MMRTLIFAVLALIALFPSLACAQPAAAAFKLETPAKHIAILDYATGALLYCDDCRTPMQPASMSKLMTSLIVAEQLKAGKIKPDTQFQVSEKAWRNGAISAGSHMFLELNSQARVADLLAGVAIVSANDACIVLAEGIAGSEAAFVERMNARAKELGLTSARFTNTTGLPDPDHMISAYDLAVLTAHIVRRHPDLYALYARPDFTFNGKTQQNRNPLLRGVPGADGVKTGHTSASGYGLIGSAQRQSERRIIVFNGLSSMAARAEAAASIMDAAFEQFAMRTLFEKGATIGAAPVFLGGRQQVALIAPEAIRAALPRQAWTQAKATIVFNGPLPAPIKQGEIIAELVLEAPGQEPQRFPLAAARDVGRMNPFGRALFGLGLLLGGHG